MRGNYLKLIVVVCVIMQLLIAGPAVLATEPANPQVLDSDGDGVPDDIDQCPNTPRGVLVDLRNGCWAYALSGAQFDFDSNKIKSKAHPMLNEVVEAMKRYPEAKVEIQGHTDSVGSAAYNMKLSENRAKAFMEYLVEKGIDPKRLSAKGFGAKKPIANNNTPEGQAKNRRVHVVRAK
jgi:OOP family OmpA-OmpF porin